MTSGRVSRDTVFQETRPGAGSETGDWFTREVGGATVYRKSTPPNQQNERFNTHSRGQSIVGGDRGQNAVGDQVVEAPNVVVASRDSTRGRHVGVEVGHKLNLWATRSNISETTSTHKTECLVIHRGVPGTGVILTTYRER